MNVEKPIHVQVAEQFGLKCERHYGDFPGWYYKRTRLAMESVGGVEEYWEPVPEAPAKLTAILAEGK